MRILLVHNHYGSTAPSGENKVFEAEKAMLEKHGETVDVYTRHSDEIRVGNRKEELGIRGKIRKLCGMIKGAMCTVGNPFAARALRKKIKAFNPDVVHFHNQFPLISPLAIRAAHKAGCKVVMTLHNYRLVCAGGIPMRDGHVCTECFLSKDKTSAVHLHPFSSPSLKHRCYRDSLLATLPLAINIWLYRHCWARWVDRFIVLSEFQKTIMIECGLPEEKIAVKGNFIQGTDVEKSDGGERKNQILFVGRLSDEKGVKTLIEARKILSRVEMEKGGNETRLAIVGDGDQRDEYKMLASGLNIDFLEQKSHDEVMQLIKQSKCVVQPSVCWETFGMVVAEGMSAGTPAVVSDLGALPDLIGGEDGACGEVFEAGNAEALATAIKRLLERPDYDVVCERCKKRVEKRYSEEANYRQMMAIYQK